MNGKLSICKINRGAGPPYELKALNNLNNDVIFTFFLNAVH